MIKFPDDIEQVKIKLQDESKIDNDKVSTMKDMRKRAEIDNVEMARLMKLCYDCLYHNCPCYHAELKKLDIRPMRLLLVKYMDGQSIGDEQIKNRINLLVNEYYSDYLEVINRFFETHSTI